MRPQQLTSLIGRVRSRGSRLAPYPATSKVAAESYMPERVVDLRAPQADSTRLHALFPHGELHR